ncbi:MAG: hypothetical protein U0359_42520 [Byssovorax sp.]
MWRPVRQHVRATELLQRFSASEAPRSPEAPVEETLSIPALPGPVRARLYRPAGVSHPPAVVLVHGVHYKGIDEPRLVRFARAVAASGILVLTPEIEELADYHVDPRSIDTVGASIRALKGLAGAERVGVMGFSFGGGLALLAAADERFAGDTAFVVAVGAHDDLGRVSRFFAGDGIADPEGRAQDIRAHEYGAMVLVYAHVERFFPAADVEAARDALRSWLHEDRDAARASAARLSPASREKVEQLFLAHLDVVRPELERAIAELGPEMTRVSPHDHLGGVRAPVFLLHGAGDTVIPASESAWLAASVPSSSLREALVSPAIVHVELEGEPGWRERWAIVHFMAQVLGEADTAASPAASG